ncbi:TRAP transporter large permease [Lachnoclostridium edouardi]|uniref:TRAP transporter large permease n=1 Tax=Lachnoclostridium edouardi TaxID=1926283 RepID=UPI000C7D6C5E|nr:TRAP transporter large permease [Lachnoclostridium edouardi]
MVVGILFLLFLALLALAVPIGGALAGVCLVGTDVFGIMKPDLYVRTLVTAIDTFPILAVALFMISGELMSKGGIARQLFHVAHGLVGKMTAGHALAAILTCMMFGAISGSGPAAVAAIGGLMIPMMSKIGYDKTFSAALIAAAGGLGVIIPPSIPMVMYGVTTGVSVSDLFAAGVVPGIISGLALMIYAYWYCKKTKPVIVWDEEEKGILTIINESKWSLLFPVIILGGIYGGIFTPTEAAAVAVFYALIISIFVTRQIKIKEVPQIFVESAASIGPLMFVVTAATVFGKILTLLQTPVIVAEALSKVTNNILILLLIINIFLLFVGAIMDTVAAIVILAPILLPLVEAYGVHPIHFGIIMVVNLAIGFITPPIGINLYVASGISNVPIMQIVKKALLPMVALGAALFIITYIEGLSLIFA